MAANFEYYKIFYYVAKYQNFTLAAHRLSTGGVFGYCIGGSSLVVRNYVFCQ